MKTKHLDNEIERLNILQGNDELSEYGEASLIEFLEIKQALNIASVSAFVCPDCKGSNMAESNKREMWCNDCEENYRENEC